MKKLLAILLIATMSLNIMACGSSISKDDYEELEEKVDELKAQQKELLKALGFDSYDDFKKATEGKTEEAKVEETNEIEFAPTEDVFEVAAEEAVVYEYSKEDYYDLYLEEYRSLADLDEDAWREIAFIPLGKVVLMAIYNNMYVDEEAYISLYTDGDFHEEYLGNARTRKYISLVDPVIITLGSGSAFSLYIDVYRLEASNVEHVAVIMDDEEQDGTVEIYDENRNQITAEQALSLLESVAGNGYFNYENSTGYISLDESLVIDLKSAGYYSEDYDEAFEAFDEIY